MIGILIAIGGCEQSKEPGEVDKAKQESGKDETPEDQKKGEESNQFPTSSFQDIIFVNCEYIGLGL